MLFAAALDHLDDLTLDVAVLASLKGELSATWAPLKNELVGLGPEQIEAAQVVRFALFAMQIAEVLGPQQVPVAQALGEHLGRVLVASELRHRDVTAHFALRQLGQALHDFFQVVEGFAQFTQDLSGRELALILGQARAELEAGEPMPPEVERLFRAELFITLALDHLDAPPVELARWTRAAVATTRKLTAFVQTEGWASIRADLARMSAEHAHADWTAEDLDDEFGPWPGQTAP